MNESTRRGASVIITSVDWGSVDILLHSSVMWTCLHDSWDLTYPVMTVGEGSRHTQVPLWYGLVCGIIYTSFCYKQKSSGWWEIWLSEVTLGTVNGYKGWGSWILKSTNRWRVWYHHCLMHIYSTLGQLLMQPPCRSIPRNISSKIPPPPKTTTTKRNMACSEIYSIQCTVSTTSIWSTRHPNFVQYSTFGTKDILFF